jgi:glycosyltransferase involved in cell wall biosynthesis
MIKKHAAWRDADVVTIHTYADFFSYLALPSLTESKPTVMTLHDMWNYTGHCYVSLDCDRWKTGCGRCPYPEMHRPINRDSSHIEWRLKTWAYSRSKLTVVAPSTAYADQARQSMLGRFRVHHIPHGVDTDTYKPLDRTRCRSLLGIASGKKVLMFMSKSLGSSVKGGNVLSQVLKRLPQSVKADLLLLLVGNQGGRIAQALDVPFIDFGYVSSDRLKAICYSAADLFVHPTRGESFGLVLLESMACGTPMVSYRVGGVTDLVRPGITGYLAEQGSPNDLLHGIALLLKEDDLRRQMGVECREIAVREYGIELQAQRYLSLYTQLLASARSSNNH